MLTSLELPRTGAEAATLAREPGSVVLAGGTIVMPRILEGGHPWTRMVALRRSALSGIHPRGERIQLGATTTLHELELHPDLGFLNHAIRSIGSANLRNLATVGGNLFVAQPYGDLAVCLLALDAEVQVEDGLTRQAVPVEQLFSNAGIAGLVASVAFTKPPEANWFYRKAARRTFNAASIVTIAARVTCEDGVVSDARIALGGCGPRPVRARTAEQALVGRPLDRKSVEEAAAVVGTDADPFTDAHATSWYRARVLPVHFRRAFLGE